MKSVELSEADLEKLTRCFLIEETPLGCVKMYYSHEDESFIYWSENQVPYKLLEAVSRKYVIDYDSKYIHVDMEEEVEKQKQSLMNLTDNSRTDGEAVSYTHLTLPTTPYV